MSEATVATSDTADRRQQMLARREKKLAELQRRRDERAAQEAGRDEGPPLMIAGRFWPLDFTKGELIVGGRPALLHQIANSGQGTGFNVWDCSVVLAKYLEKHGGGPGGLRGKNVVEVGAGPGLGGIAAALLGASVVITDLEEVVPLMSINAQINQESARSAGGALSAARLDWRTAEQDVPLVLSQLGTQSPSSPGRTEGVGVDVVLVADAIWVEELIAPLVNALVVLMQHSVSPITILLAYQSRSKRADDILFKLLDDHHLALEGIRRQDMDAEFSAAHIGIFRVTGSPSARRDAPETAPPIGDVLTHSEL